MKSLIIVESHNDKFFIEKLRDELGLKNIELKDYMFGATEQNIIANKDGISVMCVNPKEGKIQGFN